MGPGWERQPLPKEGTIPTNQQEFTIDCPGCEGTGQGHGLNGQCINCSGNGTKLVKLTIPGRGSKVRVRVGNEVLLEDLFGRDENGQPKVTPDSVGVVHDVQMPEDHHLELGPTNLGVRVDFEGNIKKDGALKKNSKNVVLWTFDLWELKVV